MYLYKQQQALLSSTWHGDAFRITGLSWREFFGGFHSQGPIMRSYDVSFVMGLSKLWPVVWGAFTLMWRHPNRNNHLLCLRQKITGKCRHVSSLRWQCGIPSGGHKAALLSRHPALLAKTWASCQIRKIAVCACAGNVGNGFPATEFKGNW